MNIANHTKQSVKKITEDTDRDNFMSAEDAVRLWNRGQGY